MRLRRRFFSQLLRHAPKEFPGSQGPGEVGAGLVDDWDIPAPDEAGVGTDGLYFVEGSLVVVKPRLKQVSRLLLNDALDAVEIVEILAGEDPALAYPTAGVVVVDKLVFVATSHADVPRNADSPIQHPEVLIQSLRVM